MKKSMVTIMAAVVAAVFGFVGCSNLDSTESQTSVASFGKYSDIANEVVKGLDEAFSSNNTSVVDESQNSVEILQGKTSSAYLLEKGVISAAAVSYIDQVENIVNSGLENSAELNSAITEIESLALKNLSGTDLDAVMTYSEVAKNTAIYLADDGLIGSERSVWGKIKNGLKKAADVTIATAVGAATGAAIGTMTGAGVGSIPGSVVGAIVGGVTSGVATAASGDIKIIS